MYRRILPLLFVILAFLPLTIHSAAPSSLLIIQNTGQYHPDVRYLVLGGSSRLWLAENSLWLTLPPENKPTDLLITFPGANPYPHLEPAQPLSTNISYYQGGDPANWHEQVPVFGSVRYTNLYPGIDLEITGQNGQITLRASESIEMEIAGGAAPRALTLQPGQPTPLEKVISLTDAGETTAALAAAPDGSPLLYSTFLGSNGLDEAQAIATDDLGRIYLAGQMLPIPPPFASQPLHAVEAFIARFTPNGSDVEYLTIILGDVEDWGRAVAVNTQYEAFFTGETDSSNYPTTPGAYDTIKEDTSFDIFLTKFDADGEMDYSTLLGKSQWDSAYAVAVDEAGNAYVTGDTQSPDFPATADAFDDEHNGPRDIYIAKFNPNGSQLLYSTFIGGENIERAEALVLTATNVVHITGWTSSSDFPTTANAYDTTYNSAVDAFALKFTLGSSMLTYGTFLGGSFDDRGYALELDAAGRAFITGVTSSNNFPATSGAYDTTFGGGPPACDGLQCPDAFAARLSANGQTLDYATFLGHSNWDQANGITVDTDGNVYLVGDTHSGSFPTSPDAYDAVLTGSRDAFLTVFNSSFNTLLYSTFLGGSNEDDGNTISLGITGGVFLGGDTNSSDFPTTAGAYDTSPNGDFDGFAVLLTLSFNPYLTPTPTITPSPALTPTGTLPTPTSSSTPANTLTPTITPSPALTPTPTSSPKLDQNIYIPFVKGNP